MRPCGLSDSGRVFYQDDYGILYLVEWTKNGDNYDFTTVTSDPRPPGEAEFWRIENNVLYKRGLVTTHRLIARFIEDGYEILAEGTESVIEFFQASFPGTSGPQNTFCYDNNNWVSDPVECLVTCGAAWCEPDGGVYFGEISDDGDLVSATPQPLSWVDVWSNTPADLTAVCP